MTSKATLQRDPNRFYGPCVAGQEEAPRDYTELVVATMQNPLVSPALGRVVQKHSRLTSMAFRLHVLEAVLHYVTDPTDPGAVVEGLVTIEGRLDREIAETERELAAFYAAAEGALLGRS
ncbi:hypothetical protein [Burkholderia sp. Ac-20353]|uniref:hypothetical protein n=1 Tax=Burkholderia sp. Ac-20353 TaxID=2703894 RepID=UPI00197B47E6|nr:hypothetical protein [Burkholderia sp. Ac-20353]MBN3789303.1 hypothetical protein [Burkholderia sp. Ac-20353]